MSAPAILRAGSGQPLVFLHGIGGAARLWAPQIEHFGARGYDAIAYDLPGYGNREPLRGPITFEELTDDLDAVLASLGVRRPVLVGHSLGGMIVQTWLRRHPEEARAAVLSGTSPAFGDPKGEFQRKFLADRLGPLDQGWTMRDLAPRIVATLVGPSPDPAGLALAESCMAATPSETYRAMMNCLVTFDERGSLGRIRVPVLALAAEADASAPARMMRKMAGYIPGARYAEVRGAGHLPNVEAPQAFNEAVADFLQSVVERERAGPQ